MERVEFTINGEKYSVGSNEVTSDWTLLDFLRKSAELRGTKYMCKEAGCGACIVTAVTGPDGVTKSVNSCMVTITSCHGWDITTVEGLGNRLKGYHSIQKTLAKYNGTQCGFCTPGWVMNMYSFLQSKPRVEQTMLETEKYFASNICRCTGYRSIMDAFKSYAKDAPEPNLDDIEDLHICKKSGTECRKDSCDAYDWCFVKKDDVAQNDRVVINFTDGKTWYRVFSVNDLLTVLRDVVGDKSYMLVGGNTAKGAYPILEYPEILIDITDIEELKTHAIDQNLIIRSGVTLTELINICVEVSQQDGFEYLRKFKEHLDLVAHVAVRNIGTVGGNLMTKYQHNDFPSDPFLLFETVGAYITIWDANGGKNQYPIKDFLKIDMNKKIIYEVKLPPLNEDEYKFVSFKILPRNQNAVARVNAGFLYKLNNNNVAQSARIVIGGINPSFIHADNTEKYITGKNLFVNETLQGALAALDKELVVSYYPEEEHRSRKKIGLSLLYKGLITICPIGILNSRFISGIKKLGPDRPVSKGTQVYDTNSEIWPLNQPIPKIEALIQCAGEAPYSDDTPTQPGEVFAAFVLATIPRGEIESIDIESAMKLDGVVGVYTAKDIPGPNNFSARDYIYNFSNEEILADPIVRFHGMPVAILVATDEHKAERAAKLVKVNYKNTVAPKLTINEAKTDLTRLRLIVILPQTDVGVDIDKIITGTVDIESQYHFHFEKLTCVTIPSEDGLDVIASTQWIDAVQLVTADALKIKGNDINMKVRRIGGGFGAKISRASQIAVACNLVAYKMNRPCRMVLPLTTNMKAIGKRLPSQANFKVSVNKKGAIQNLTYSLFEDHGCIINEPFTLYGLEALKNTYERSKWTFQAFDVITDTPSNSWCRSPGTLEYIAMIEHIMEKITHEQELDPIDVRLENVPPFEEDDNTRKVIKRLKTEGEYEKRKEEVKKHNKEHRWSKKGLRFSCMKFPVINLSIYACTIGVNHGDGSVVITHGGIEMGQGINTKAVQVCAYTLKIPMERIAVKATNLITNPNCHVTGGSWTSESICVGIIKCCQILLDRLAPLKSGDDNIEWDDLIDKAHKNGVNLLASYNETTNDQYHYYVYGACLTEVEIDVLTGEFQVIRVDLVEDVGQSLSPEVDVGQIEGAFVMGLGYWTTEHLRYNKNTGELETDRTWNYHVPQARDIPQDFRVYFEKNSPNEKGILRSKATGEPATCLAVSVPFAIREAITSSRRESSIPKEKLWFEIKGAYTLDKIIEAADVKLTEMVYS